MCITVRINSETEQTASGRQAVFWANSSLNINSLTFEICPTRDIAVRDYQPKKINYKKKKYLYCDQL